MRVDPKLHPEIQEHLKSLGRQDLIEAGLSVDSNSFHHFRREVDSKPNYEHLTTESKFCHAVISAYFHPNHTQEKSAKAATHSTALDEINAHLRKIETGLSIHTPANVRAEWAWKIAVLIILCLLFMKQANG